MNPRRVVTAFTVLAAFAHTSAFAGQGSEWNSSGSDRQNTRSQPSEHILTTANVNKLEVKWAFTAHGDVSATPAVDSDTVYFPDWGGYINAVDRATGALRWSVKVSDITGVAFDKARTTPAVTDDKIIFGTQGSVFVPGGGPGANVVALKKATGAVAWMTHADAHFAAIISQSAVVFDGRVYIGVASQEEALAAFVPGYQLSFRGSLLSLDAATGQILWKTFTAPPGYTGDAVWGSSPAIDLKRKVVYIATGNNYSVPQPVLDCVATAGDDPVAKAACLPADDHFDSILAIDARTGAIRWATRAIPFDAWTVDCIPMIGDGDLCPSPAGPDYDFGQGPALFRSKAGNEFVGAGQKSGQYWSLNADTGAVNWVTNTGPGGTAGGLQWGSAVDGTRVYVANSNSNANQWTPLGGSLTDRGGWSALDAATGQILWQRVDPNPPGGVGGGPAGPVSTANGIVFGCSLDVLGYMYAFNAATGAQLWSYPSGGSCLSGAAIVDGAVYWGSGYSNFGFGTANNKLYKFGLP